MAVELHLTDGDMSSGNCSSSNLQLYNTFMLLYQRGGREVIKLKIHYTIVGGGGVA